MFSGRDHDADGFDGSESLLQAPERLHTQFGSQSVRAFVVLVVNPCQLRALNAFKGVCMPFPVLSYANNGNGHFPQL